MESPPIIRAYEPSDHAGVIGFLERVLADLGFEFLPDGKDSDIRDLGLTYVQNGGSFCVVDVAGEVFGTIAIRRLTTDTAELKRLYLDQSVRGTGIGRGLCIAAIEDARQLGYRHLRLDTTTRSPAAIALFKKLGFYEIERYNSDPYAEIFMEYAL